MKLLITDSVSTVSQGMDTLSNNVDTSTDGTYEVVYKVIDSHGNKTEFTQNIVVETGRTKIIGHRSLWSEGRQQGYI